MSPAEMHSALHEKGRTDMASSGKKKTTMAKLNRESKLRERRLDKQARKDARKRGLDPHPNSPDLLDPVTGMPVASEDEQPALEPAVEALAEA
jgi:hypothetical protein